MSDEFNLINRSNACYYIKRLDFEKSQIIGMNLSVLGHLIVVQEGDQVSPLCKEYLFWTLLISLG